MFAPRGWLSGRGNQAVYRTLTQSALFDPKWYRKTYLSGVEKLQDPLWHFIHAGWQKGWDPSPRFDTQFYLWWNKDVRESRVNPVDHFVNYGEAEGRPALTPLAQWWPDHLKAVSPIKFYTAPQKGKKRVTLVLDVNTPRRWKGDVALAMITAAWLGHSLGRDVRILVRDDAALEIPKIDKDVFHWPGPLAPQITHIPTGIEYSDIARYEDEIFVATSWSSAHSLHNTFGGTQLIYLVSEDEPATVPAGESRSLAHSALHLEGVTYLPTAPIDQTELWPHTKPPHNVVHEKNLNLGFFVKKTAQHADSQAPIVIWSGNSPDRANTRGVLASIEKAAAEGAIDLENNPVVLAGATATRLLLLGSHEAAATQPATPAEEIALIASGALVIALGSTTGGHPVSESARVLGQTALSDSDFASSSQSMGDIVGSALKEHVPASGAAVRQKSEVQQFAKRLGKYFA
jgi:hypothetical protein